jgi:hypothetical protein
MSSHPGSTLKDALELAIYLKKEGYAPEQVQDFYPTPGTASTVMYYTGINPFNGKSVYVPTDYHEKLLQRALLQYNRPANAPLVREAIKLCGREDLIGYGKDALVKPDNSPQKQNKLNANIPQKTNQSRSDMPKKDKINKITQNNVKTLDKTSKKNQKSKTYKNTRNDKNGKNR